MSANFKVKEFRCQDESDTILIDTELINTLETMRSRLGCKAINIKSGYRTASHNAAVGGSKTSKHIEGRAADIECISANGQLIPAKQVCCAMEDVGYQGGVAYIKGGNRTHIDTRGKKFYFDETASGNMSVRMDVGSFYTHWGIVKKNPYKQPDTTVCMGMKGDAVKWLQWELNQTGYGLDNDGSFGGKTDTALRAFQKKNGLAVDGKCGPKTRAKLTQ